MWFLPISILLTTTVLAIPLGSYFAMMLFPFALVLMYGHVLNRKRHAWVIFSVMMFLMIGTVAWSIYFDTLKPNPGFTSHPGSRKL